ncbi:MAG: LPS-assembly protein, partial [Bacteroidia bacterium]
ANKDIDPQASNIEARANTTELRNDELILTGGVSADQGYRQMRGDSVVVDRNTGITVLSGNVSLREPGVLLRGEQAQIDTGTDEAKLYEGQFVFHREHMRGTARLLERNEQGLVKIHDGEFSFCAPDENDWALASDRLDLNIEDGIATAYDARIEVEGIPLIYTPWLRFPLDDRRTTGFLWPDFGNDSTGGLDVTVPFYINLAPDYDALYSARFIEERGLNHELQLRYLDPLKGNWLVGGAYMGSDDRFEDQATPQRSADRWLGVIRHDGLIDQRWRSRVNYSKASDVDYMKDLETSNLDSQRRTSLLQLASLDYLGDNWLVSAEAQQFQSLADDINDDYKKLPQFTAAYRSLRTPFEIQPIALAQYSNFDTDEDRVIGHRLYAEAGATYPMQWTYGFLDSTLKYRQLAYELSELQLLTDDNPTAGSALGSVDGGLIFERFTDLGGKNMLQTLEPRLYYQYSEFEEQNDQPDFDSGELTFSYNQLFRSTRFSGKDRLDDSNQLAVGLTTRFIDSEDGRDVFSGSLGQIFYFRDRKVRLSLDDETLDDSSSEIAGELTFNPSEEFGLRTSLIYDPQSGNMNSGHVSASYQDDRGGIFNLGYSYRRPQASLVNQQTTEEASLSTYLPLGNNWSAFAAINYSMVSNESVEDMVGVEYDSCCWTVRVLHLRYYNNVSGETVDFDDPDLERENTIQFQIILKGMGGFGDRITDIMEDMIRGFEERDY